MPPETPEAEIAVLQTQYQHLEGTMADVREDIKSLKADVHEIRELVVELKASARAYTRAGDLVFAFLTFGAAGWGLHENYINGWQGLLLVLMAGILQQHGSLNKFASMLLRSPNERTRAGEKSAVS
jgi:hypothetical protein